MAIRTNTSRDSALDFLQSHPVGVLATTDELCNPYATTIYFTSNTEGNIHFLTRRDTRKNRDLQFNGKAAAALYDKKTQTTLQIQGIVQEVTDQQMIDQVLDQVWKTTATTSTSALPPASKLAAGPYVVYELIPEQTRLATFVHADSHDIFETIQ